jgi:polyhydroxybutyrate depolymerase
MLFLRSLVSASLSLLLFCTAGQSGQTQAQERSQWSEATLPQGSLTRYFRYYVPKNLPKNAPVVILLHGGTQSMRKVVASNSGGSQAWPDLAEREKFLLIVPNGVDPTTGDPAGDRQNWHDCRTDQASIADDVGFVRQLIDWAGQTYLVNDRRIYATGSSNGGMMAYRLGMEMPDRTAAIAAFVANLPADSECQPMNQPIPTMMANGTDDPSLLRLAANWQSQQMFGEKAARVVVHRESAITDRPTLRPIAPHTEFCLNLGRNCYII